jgi:endoglucanase
VIAQRKPMLTAIQTAAHLSFATCGGTPAPPVSQSVWPEGVSELRVPVLGSSSEFWTTEARVAYVTYAKLPFAMTPGGTYAVRDSWGNLATFSYDGATPSWSIATNQVGYVADAPAKYAYVGAWLGTSGELDVAPFAGKPFTVVDDASGAAVLTGTASVARGDDTYSGQPVRGASALQLDLSSLSTPGTYRVAVPGVGTSRRFVVGPDAIGEPFYVHARGLYHARCGTLDPTLTPWARGDAHQTTLVAAFPPEDDDYKDHSAQGWGFRDAAGKYAAHTTFDAVARTATTTPLTGVAGGWHDAGDFDRNSHHLGAVEDLAYAYLHFPQNFSDGQLHLPESGNGVPDLLDEATWGIDVFRRSQAADGRVSTRIESTSHPKAWDPGKDPAPYYASLPTRTGSLRYAAAAATLSRALATAGAKTASATWLDSAKRAYSFGTSAARAEITLSVGTAVHTWKEAPAPDATQRLHAAMALSIATKDPHYLADLALPEVAAAFTAELATYQDQGTPMRMADVALAPAAALPAGWTTQARAKVLAAAATWKGWQDAEPYRKLWYPPTHALFWTMGWGNDGYVPIRHLIAGYRVSGDATYRRAALLAVDWMLGANPQGKSLTTGLGAVPPQTVLHLPSMIDGLAEPAPGITPFGYVEGTVSQFAASRIYGIFDAANAGYGFAAAAIPLLPAAMSSGATTTTTITAKLAATWPIWHRQTLLDQQNPPTTEFTVYETIAPAAAVTGCLLSPGWKPSASLLARAPRTPEAARDALWALPLHTQYRFQTPMRAPGDREARIATSMPRVRRR